MKILYVGNFISKHGTTPNFNVYLVPKLRESHEVATVSERQSKLFRLADMLGAIWKNRKWANLILIDVYSSSAFWYAFAVARLARMLGIPYINILHGGNLPMRLKNNPKHCKELFGKAAGNASPSRYLEEAFSREGFDVRYIPNFLNIGTYQYKYRDSAAPKILYVRSLHEIYNPTLAVKVLHQLREKGIAAELCMVGPDKDGSLQKVQDLAQELGVAPFLRLTGKLSLQEWMAVAAEYGVFINTTNLDNLPVSILEAMALGFPIVSTNVGGLPFLIEHGKDGLLVPPDNADAFTGELIRLFESPELAAHLSKSAREKSETFDWGVVQGKWSKMIQDATTITA